MLNAIYFAIDRNLFLARLARAKTVESFYFLSPMKSVDLAGEAPFILLVLALSQPRHFDRNWLLMI